MRTPRRLIERGSDRIICRFRFGRKLVGVQGGGPAVLTVVLCLSFAVDPANGQVIERFNRVTVVAKIADLKIGSRVVGHLARGRTLTVSDIKGGWIWIAEPDSRGWMRASEVRPPDEAIRLFSDLIRREPTAENYVIRARLVSPDQAIADYTAAIRLDPTKPHYYKERGIEQYIRRQLDEAIADYSLAIRLDPQNSSYFFVRANARREKGELDLAIADYSEAIRLNPEDAQAYRDRAGLWARKSEYDRAIADYDQSIRLNGSDVLLSMDLLGRAGARLSKGDQQLAMDDIDEAVRISADNPWSRDIVRGARVVALLQLEQYDRAISDLEEAIPLNPQQAGLYAIMAWFRATCPDAAYRDGAKAIVYGTKAIELSRQPSPDRAAVLAAAYAQAGDFSRAIHWQQKAIDLAPEGEKREYRGALESYIEGTPWRRRGWEKSARPRFFIDSFIQ